jgi:hypothetical protein
LSNSEIEPRYVSYACCFLQRHTFISPGLWSVWCIVK